MNALYLDKILSDFVRYTNPIHIRSVLRYGWEIKNLPSTCACGAHFNPSHALQCPTGGFTITSHNDVRDLLAESLREVSTNVGQKLYLV